MLHYHLRYKHLGYIIRYYAIKCKGIEWQVNPPVDIFHLESLIRKLSYYKTCLNLSLNILRLHYLVTFMQSFSRLENDHIHYIKVIMLCLRQKWVQLFGKSNIEFCDQNMTTFTIFLYLILIKLALSQYWSANSCCRRVSKSLSLLPHIFTPKFTREERVNNIIVVWSGTHTLKIWFV